MVTSPDLPRSESVSENVSSPRMVIDNRSIDAPRPRRSTALWSIQKSCNLNCTYCYGSFDGSSYKSLLGEKGVALEQVERTLCQLVERGIEVVHISGGEPLLHHRFWDLVRLIRDAGLRCTITTNATILSKEDRRMFKENLINHVMVSLDTLDQEYGNQVRERHETVVKNLSWLLQEHRSGKLDTGVGIYCVVSRLNIDAADRLAHWAAKMGAYPVSFQPIHLPTHHPDFHELSLTPGEAHRLQRLRQSVSQISSLQKANPDWFWESWVSMMDKPASQMEARPCFAGDDLVYIDSDGGMFRCPAYEIVKNEGPLAKFSNDLTARGRAARNCEHLSFDCLCIWKLACIGLEP